MIIAIGVILILLGCLAALTGIFNIKKLLWAPDGKNKDDYQAMLGIRMIYDVIGLIMIVLGSVLAFGWDETIDLFFG